MVTKRRLATLRTINEVRRLKGPRFKAYDVVAIDGGWSVVVFHGEFFLGQLVLFFEIDSFIPATDGRFCWEDSRDMTVSQGVRGFHVRSQMFDKQISQGLVRSVRSLRVLLFYFDQVFPGREKTLHKP